MLLPLFLPFGELITPHLLKIKMWYSVTKTGERQMKELKDCYIKFRVTAAMKDKITEYCDNFGYTVSEFLRKICEEYFAIREDENESAYN